MPLSKVLQEVQLSQVFDFQTKKLRLNNFGITELDFVNLDIEVKEIELSSNNLKSLKGFSQFQKLEKIDVSSNRISGLEQLDFLSSLNSLLEIILVGNPIDREPKLKEIL